MHNLYVVAGILSIWSLLLSSSVLALLDDGASSGREWTFEEVHPGQAGQRRMLSAIPTVKGLPKRFTIRSMIDTSLCVHLANLSSPDGQLFQDVVEARAANGLPYLDLDSEVQKYGSNHLVLLPCAGGRTDTFLAETILGRFYQNNSTNYRQGFLKPKANNGICVYGVNATYTAGHPVFGVSGTAYYSSNEAASNTAAADNVPLAGVETATEMDWFDEYLYDYAPYIKYGYDPATMVTSGIFKSPFPLPNNALDASGWGPFHSTWGDCMRNPTLDTSTPEEHPDTEVALHYQAWIFLDATDSASVSHLPKRVRANAFTLLTLGPDRPQPNMSPDAGQVDAGELSAELGGMDQPYGNGYSAYVSKELCMTTESVRAGALVRLARCNPVRPSLEQVFQLKAVAA